MLTVILHRLGHAPEEEVHVYSIEEASECVMAFQRKWAMTSSDCAPHHGGVYVGRAMPHIVSYNGCV